MAGRSEKLLWQLYARVYDSILLRFWPYRRLMSLVADAVDPAPGWRILDAGCGTGNLLVHLARTRPDARVTGVDFAPAMLRRAGKKVRGLSGVTLREADLNRPLPFADGEFDAVVCVNTLYAVDKPALLLGELHRVLKRNGRFVLVNPSRRPQMRHIFIEHVRALRCGYPGLWPVLLAGQVLRTLPQLLVFVMINGYIQGQQPFHFFTGEELKKVLSRAGFGVTRAEKVYGGQCWLKVGTKTLHGFVAERQGGRRADLA